MISAWSRRICSKTPASRDRAASPARHGPRGVHGSPVEVNQVHVRTNNYAFEKVGAALSAVGCVGAAVLEQVRARAQRTLVAERSGIAR